MDGHDSRTSTFFSPSPGGRGAGGIGIERINGEMKWPFVIRGHKPSTGHPSPFRERGLGVRAKLPVSQTPKSPNCGDCARGTVRRANALPSPQPSPRGRGWSTRDLPAQFCRLSPMGAAGEVRYSTLTPALIGFPQVCPGFHHREHRVHRDGWEVKKGSEPDPEPFASGLCGLCALCGETPDRTGGRQVPRESWLARMTPALPRRERAKNVGCG